MTASIITLSGSTESLTKSLRDYTAAWKAFIVVHHLDLLENLATPVTLSWKVADKPALYANLDMLGTKVEQLHIGTVNERFIASAVLHEAYENMPIVKILERRAGSSDPLGLDSIDYLVKDLAEIERLLQDSGAHIERQHNDMHEWLSLRFGKNLEFEAKFVDNLVLDVAIRELRQANAGLSKLYRQSDRA